MARLVAGAEPVEVLRVVASQVTTTLPWLWVLLGLVGLQVVVLCAMGRARRAQTQLPQARAEPDWKAVEDDLARMLGPAMRELVDDCGGRPPDVGRVQALAESLASRAGASHGLAPSGSEALARSLSDELLRIALPAPTH